MIKNQIKKILWIFILFSLLGCKTKFTDLTLISTKKFETNEISQFEIGNKKVEGKDMSYMILFFPIGLADFNKAIDNAIEKTPGAVALVDVSIYNYILYTFFFNKIGIIIEGKPLINPKLIKNNKISN